MRKFTILVGNVNIYNHCLIDRIAGDAGYMGAPKSVDMCAQKFVVTIENDIEHSEVCQMIGQYILAGFTVTTEEVE